MKKNIVVLTVGVIVLFGFFSVYSFAMYRASTQAEGSLDAATWSVSRNQSASTDSIEVMPELMTDTYTLTVTNNSEVDVIYSIIINNVPAGVEVTLDNVVYRPTANTITIPDAGTINYNDQDKTVTRTLLFSATSSAQVVTDQEIDINVEFRQVV